MTSEKYLASPYWFKKGYTAATKLKNNHKAVKYYSKAIKKDPTGQ